MSQPARTSVKSSWKKSISREHGVSSFARTTQAGPCGGPNRLGTSSTGGDNPQVRGIRGADSPLVAPTLTRSAQPSQRLTTATGGRVTVSQRSRIAGTKRQGLHAKRTEVDAEEERQVLTSGVQNLHVHDFSFASHELLLNSDGFPNLRNGDLVQIYQPTNPERRFTLAVGWLSDVRSQTSTRLQVSILKSVAEAFGLTAFCDVKIHGPVEPDSPETEVSFVELHFKDQYISRGDLWRFNEATINLPAYRGKVFVFFDISL